MRKEKQELSWRNRFTIDDLLTEEEAQSILKLVIIEMDYNDFLSKFFNKEDPKTDSIKNLGECIDDVFLLIDDMNDKLIRTAYTIFEEKGRGKYEITAIINYLKEEIKMEDFTSTLDDLERINPEQVREIKEGLYFLNDFRNINLKENKFPSVKELKKEYDYMLILNLKGIEEDIKEKEKNIKKEIEALEEARLMDDEIEHLARTFILERIRQGKIVRKKNFKITENFLNFFDGIKKNRWDIYMKLRIAELYYHIELFETEEMVPLNFGKTESNGYYVKIPKLNLKQHKELAKQYIEENVF